MKVLEVKTKAVKLAKKITKNIKLLDLGSNIPEEVSNLFDEEFVNINNILEVSCQLILIDNLKNKDLKESEESDFILYVFEKKLKEEIKRILKLKLKQKLNLKIK